MRRGDLEYHLKTVRSFNPDPELRSIYYVRKSAAAVLRERKQDPVWIAGLKFAWEPHRNVPVVLPLG